jgi:hypothetical protein
MLFLCIEVIISDEWLIFDEEEKESTKMGYESSNEFFQTKF